MPRGVGHSKLTPLLALNPRVSTWTSPAAFKAAKPAGLSEKTIDAIVDAIPAYLAWKAATGLVPSTVAPSTVVPTVVPAKQYVFVFTGVRDKTFESALQAKGHIIADTVTKKTTHVVYADGATTSTKMIKAKEMGATLLPLSQAKADF